METAYIERDPGDPKKQRVLIRFAWVGVPAGENLKVPAIPGRAYTFSKISCYFFDSVPEAKDWCTRRGYRAEVIL